MLYMRLISLAEANKFVGQHHRHHKPARGCKYVLSAWKGGRMVGVAIVSRPVARRLDDGETLEIVRLCTDGTHNACTFLMGACSRIAKDMGCRRLFTYTMPSEGGASLRASGWEHEGRAGGGNWNCPGRPRDDTPEDNQVVKHRWVKTFPSNRVTLAALVAGDPACEGL